MALGWPFINWYWYIFVGWSWEVFFLKYYTRRWLCVNKRYAKKERDIERELRGSINELISCNPVKGVSHRLSLIQSVDKAYSVLHLIRFLHFSFFFFFSIRLRSCNRISPRYMQMKDRYTHAHTYIYIIYINICIIKYINIDTSSYRSVFKSRDNCFWII